MKRLCLLVLVPLFLVAPPAVAQTFEIVPQLGLTLSDYTGDDVSASTAAGFSAGGKVRVGRTFYVDGGFFWSWAGANVNFGGESNSFYIGSVQIPVTIGYRLGLTVVAIRFFAGVVPNIVTNVSTDFDVVKDDIQSTLWSGKFGAGVDVLIFAFDLAYQPGFTDLFKDPNDPEIKQNSWIFEAGFRFGF